MLIDRETVETIAAENLGKTGETPLQFLTRVVPKLIQWLQAEPPDTWKNYGLYWYTLKDLLRNYAPREYGEYISEIGGEEAFGTAEQAHEYDYGSDLLNWTAAMLYIDYRLSAYQYGAHNAHDYEGNDGVQQRFMPATGMIEQ